ncbi:hypothetical protein D3C85_1590090 [compost metagenome]
MAFTKSETIGLQPPQPEVALVCFTTSEKLEQVSSKSEQQIEPFVTFSQEQITALSGKSKTLPILEPSDPSLDPKIKSSGFLGKAMALL